MKKDYRSREIHYFWSYIRQEYIEYSSPGQYVHRYRCMRTPRTHLNRKRLAAYPEFVRPKQKHLPSNYDDIRLSFGYGSDWKRFTKKRKQYS